MSELWRNLLQPAFLVSFSTIGKTLAGVLYVVIYGLIEYAIIRRSAFSMRTLIASFGVAILTWIPFFIFSMVSVPYKKWQEAEYKLRAQIEFMSPYQAASNDTPDGKVDVAIWWIPVRLPSEQQPIKNATIRVKWHEASRYDQKENHNVRWIDKDNPDRTVSAIELIPGAPPRMINLVSRRAVNDDRGWRGVLLEETLMMFPKEHKEKIIFSPGKDQTITVILLASGKELRSQTYIVHVPPKGEHNTRFWLQDPDTLNW